MFNGIKTGDGEEITIPGLLDQIVMDICDHYCKYPEQYGENEDKLYEEHCANCPFWYLV